MLRLLSRCRRVDLSYPDLAYPDLACSDFACSVIVRIETSGGNILPLCFWGGITESFPFGFPSRLG